MARFSDEILAELKSELLSCSPGDAPAGVGRVRKLCSELLSLGSDRGSQSLLQLLEELPLTHTDITGCLGDAAASFRDFEWRLADSFQRRPVPATIRLVGQILDKLEDDEKRAFWIQQLTSAAKSPGLDDASISEITEVLNRHKGKQKDVVYLWQMMTPDIRPKKRKPGIPDSLIAGIFCTLLGAFGGCTLQFQHDVGGVGQGDANYLFKGIGIGLVVGLIMAFVVKFFDQDP